MAKIIILREGQRKGYDVTNDQLTEISKQVEEARKVSKVRIIKLQNPMIEFMTSDYRGAEYDAPNKGEDPMKTKAREWHDKRRVLAKRTPEEKTTHFMEKVFPLFKSVVPELTAEQAKAIEERTLEFFQGNPRRNYPNGDVFTFEYDKRRIGIFEQGKLRVLEKVIAEDMASVKDDEQYEMKVLGIQEEVKFTKPVMAKETISALDPRIPVIDVVKDDSGAITEKELNEIF